MLQLIRIEDDLPEGFAALREAAASEGYRHMDRLAAEHAAGRSVFVALFGALLGGELVGIGGLTHEPEPEAELAMRMRRLYVRADVRRQGVARALASALTQEGLDQVALLTVHAGDARAAAFWEAQGFAPVDHRPWSHELRR
ncbi:MAG TPA: GNAT family N-acetyltransferase [Phenylobacterium sp.]|nr:GNAT family N-acetyltransferase [Phenylobacterium sp.]HQN52350.1 GNAT family N-acetyltransferase [Phenylobacterium sp.]